MIFQLSQLLCFLIWISHFCGDILNLGFAINVESLFFQMISSELCP